LCRFADLGSSPAFLHLNQTSYDSSAQPASGVDSPSHSERPDVAQSRPSDTHSRGTPAQWLPVCPPSQSVLETGGPAAVDGVALPQSRSAEPHGSQTAHPHNRSAPSTLPTAAVLLPQRQTVDTLIPPPRAAGQTEPTATPSSPMAVLCSAPPSPDNYSTATLTRSSPGLPARG
jgi:hypothetical protein